MLKKNNPAALFEISWEVCNQVGGIYTVLKSKAPSMLKRWGEEYCLLGPYKDYSAAIEFEPAEVEGVLAEVFEELSHQGIKAHYGYWLIRGKPKCILFELDPLYARLDKEKYYLWKDHQIPTPKDDPEVNNATVFSIAITAFFQAYVKIAPNTRAIAHFHEWLGSLALVRFKHLRVPVTTIFTTHATMLGRYMAGGQNFYQSLPYIDPHPAAVAYNIESRYLIERLAAQCADLFTTISNVTAREAAHFLGRQPDAILPNGLNKAKFTALHEFQNLHLKCKNKIHEFVMGHFFPSYSFDLNKTIYIFTSGRYEYANKGMDVFIEALERLNWRLKQVPDAPTVVAFIITNAETRSVNVGALERATRYEDLRKICYEVESGMEERLLNAVSKGHLPTYDELLPREYHTRFKQAIHARRSTLPPPIVTHDLVDDGKDPVLCHLRHRGLINAPEDPVKVVFHPKFVSATGPLIDLDYEDFVRGCHLGVFPSYYEPWGYTPLECLALGIPAVTSDLAGFGAFVEDKIKSARRKGVLVLKRSDVSSHDSIDELYNYLTNFVGMTRRERIELRNKSERLSESFDWSKLSIYYHEVHKLAAEIAQHKKQEELNVSVARI